ncbi:MULTISPECIES: LysR family transcriptional regulator [unclassified Pseudomonas]|uniref:LysR family transcriptional regulator n=1 Tax=unclassified Pseudomonas TaxID=196821 RepID=UPI0021C7771E|nr:MULTISPECIES: LysR family transcriptional regulator [unclassified Pseudomonas]MCU1734330.1 LysR family transcriptional regulator [Pseudomonas sp. 20P_3.2_Bac4]MCU1746193.1 LysR family transcriptional regulator [Pseudomonas sp. 20P_3.2_Bac5]
MPNCDAQLLRTLYTLLTECSVSRTAELLGQTQPAVSVALRRLRELTGDPLLVRSGSRMLLTSHGQTLIDPVAQALEGIEQVLHPMDRFNPATTRQTFRISTPDYLSVFFVPAIVERFYAQAPLATLELTHLQAEGGYSRGLEEGYLDLVIGNWRTPADHLHLQPLCDDDLVCLMRDEHPIRPGELTQEAYTRADHLAVMTHNASGQGTIGAELAGSGLARRVTTTLPYFCIAPYVLVKSNLVFTTTRSFAKHYSELLPLRIEPFPVPAQPLRYYQLWHARKHRSEASKWLRGVVLAAARAIAPEPSLPG